MREKGKWKMFQFYLKIIIIMRDEAEVSIWGFGVWRCEDVISSYYHSCTSLPPSSNHMIKIWDRTSNNTTTVRKSTRGLLPSQSSQSSQFSCRLWGYSGLHIFSIHTLLSTDFRREERSQQTLFQPSTPQVKSREIQDERISVCHRSTQLFCQVDYRYPWMTGWMCLVKLSTSIQPMVWPKSHFLWLAEVIDGIIQGKLMIDRKESV